MAIVEHPLQAGAVVRGTATIERRQNIATEDGRRRAIVEFRLVGRNPPASPTVAGQPPLTSGLTEEGTWRAIFALPDEYEVKLDWTHPATGATLLKAKELEPEDDTTVVPYVEMFDDALRQLGNRLPPETKAAALAWLRVDLATTRINDRRDAEIAARTGVTRRDLGFIDPSQREVIQSWLRERARIRACASAARHSDAAPFLPLLRPLRRQVFAIADVITKILKRTLRDEGAILDAFTMFANGQLRRPGADSMNIEPDSFALACLPELFDVAGTRHGPSPRPWWFQRRLRTMSAAMLEAQARAYDPRSAGKRRMMNDISNANYRQGNAMTPSEVGALCRRCRSMLDPHDERAVYASWGRALETLLEDEPSVRRARRGAAFV